MTDDSKGPFLDDAARRIAEAAAYRDQASRVALVASIVAHDAPKSRETSCAITRLEEAQHWLEAAMRRVEGGR